MNNVTARVELTPAQIDFCNRFVPGFNKQPWDISIAGNAGSDRKFVRLSSIETPVVSYILVIWDSHDEDWQRFQTINEEVSVFFTVLPVIYSHDEIHGLLLVEDCGMHTLKLFCQQENKQAKTRWAYARVLDALIQWQSIGIKDVKHIGARTLDESVFLWETDYFAANCVRDYCGLDMLLSDLWHRERLALASRVAALPLVCLHRDFQSENIMIQNAVVKFVDYQGARLGPAEYDLASLLFDPYMSWALQDDLRNTLFDYYQSNSPLVVSRKTFRLAALQRLMQALGAYSKLSIHKGKEQYRQYVSPALSLLCGILQDMPEFPCIGHIAQECLRKVIHPG